MFQFAVDRQDDEHHDLDEKQENPEDLEEQGVDRQRNAGEHHQPIDPDGKAIGDDDVAQRTIQRIGWGILHAKQHPTQKPFRQCE